MRAALICFSHRGEKTGEKISSFYSEKGYTVSLDRCPDGGLGHWTEENFGECEIMMFIGSCGIAVRGIAPFVKSKLSDPAVIVVDELGTYCIPLLSGHLGGANKYAGELAKYLGAVAVITTATDINHVFAVDVWASSQNLAIINPEKIKWISARALTGEKIKFKSSVPVEGTLPPSFEQSETMYDIIVTHRTRGRADALRLVPPVVCLGVGCRKEISLEALERAFELMLARANCYSQAVFKVCSIDIKAHEPALVKFCKNHGFEFETFTAAKLASVNGSFASSGFVKSVTGVDNVCERSAVCGCGEGGRLIAGKDAGNGVTMALAMRPYKITFENEELK